MRLLRLTLAVLVLVAVTGRWQPVIAQERVLRVQGDHFTVDGQPKFLTFVSYFDAMRRMANGGVDADFDYIRAKGFDGVRIFPNWWNYGCPGSNSRAGAESLMSPDADFATNNYQLNETLFARFEQVLARAAAKGLLVDVSFTRDPVGPDGYTGTVEFINDDNYVEQMRQIAFRLRSGYRHVYFDLENEENDQPLIVRLANAVRGEDSSRLMTASTESGASEEAGSHVAAGNLSFAAVHPDRESWWWTFGAARVPLLEAQTTAGLPHRPVHVQEPMPFAHCPNYSHAVDSDIDHYRHAASHAKAAGLAAFTFHSGTSFVMTSNEYRYRVSAAEDAALTAVIAAVASTTWMRDSPTRLDFDGDHVSDYGIFTSVTPDTWNIFQSNNGPLGAWWGESGDIPTGADYNGDGLTDYAIWRPSNGHWWVRTSHDNQLYIWQWWGLPGDTPVPGDYDGDGRADLAVFRPSTQEWHIMWSSGGPTYSHQWGLPGDIPVPADYNNDGRTDLAIYRPSEGNWYSYSVQSGAVQVVQFGLSGDTPLPKDYDGDGLIDYAIFRPSSLLWYIRHSSNTAIVDVIQWGLAGDIQVPADFDGDGHADLGSYRPSNGMWYVMTSKTPGYTTFGPFGGVNEHILTK